MDMECSGSSLGRILKPSGFETVHECLKGSSMRFQYSIEHVAFYVRQKWGHLRRVLSKYGLELLSEFPRPQAKTSVFFQFLMEWLKVSSIRFRDWIEHVHFYLGHQCKYIVGFAREYGL